MATLKEVAKAAGVSMPIVSAYLRGSTSIRMSADTRRRVATAIEELGYTPNLATRSLRTARTNVLAVVVPELDNPALTDVLRGIYDGATRHGYVIMLGDAVQLTSGSQTLQHLLSQSRVDGVIVTRSSALDEGVLSGVAGRGLPVVFLDNESTDGHHWLALDDADGIRVATEHLVELGHEQIDFFGGRDISPRSSMTKLRYAGYIAALQAHKLAPRPPVICGQEPEQGYEAFSTMVAPRVVQRRRDAPTALVVNNATTAMGVLAAAYDAGVAIPGDVSVIGYHGTAVTAMARPRMSTVRMPMYELGSRGVAMLDKIIGGEFMPSGILEDIPPKAIARDTTASP
ncbi:LacI family DNA-binding transcriptional regulator [Phytoactinopolyspora endophytica]|uniref:LacI family DNA-binding transcriptional regulator n=1 Tax=Phytoactinopolyspora endophytica TaxID=1642495 RepID=UPI00101BFC79|nr:LacI family DNA-binding transcriptional regulator [Phytoactinopolyspora endophytica]